MTKEGFSLFSDTLEQEKNIFGRKKIMFGGIGLISLDEIFERGTSRGFEKRG